MDRATTHGCDAIACTGNAHKVRELAALLPSLRLEALPAGTELPPETGETFLDNARIKARAGATMFPGRWVVADDSGLEVDALDGRPGVRSARYAGEDATDADNVRLLLQELRGVDAHLRTARFRCVLVAVAPDGGELHAAGAVEGRIAHEPAGDDGFGYDPVFVPAGHESSFAQLGDEVKATMSHRAVAARELARLMAGAGAGGAGS
jgi:XTP/dITP diphosphohydrolase